MNIYVTLTVIVTIATIGALAVRGRRFPAPAGIMIVGLVMVVATIGVYAYGRIQTQRVHDQCIYNVSRSDGNRQMWLDIGMFLKDHGVANDAVVFIAEHLDTNLPQRTITECK